MSTSTPRAVRFADVLADSEFRALWLAQVVSVGGDQLARVALSLLVFARTGSVGLAALTYALTLLPELLGGPLLAWLADRYPRRGLMVTCDLARAGLVAAMALPGAPLWALCALLVAVQLLQSPFVAARAAILPTIVPGDRYPSAVAIVNITEQFGLLAGFAVGGFVVASVGPEQALLIDAGTFVVSAVLIASGLVARQTPAPTGTAQTGTRAPNLVLGGARLVVRDRRLRLLVAFGCLSGFYVCKDGLAVPYAALMDHGAAAAGLLLAAGPAGAVVGMVVLTRLVRPEHRLPLLGPLAVAACLVLVGTPLMPGIAATCALWAVSGLFSAFQVPANAEYVRTVPDAMRGQAFGAASSAVRAAQGLGVVAAGFAADHLAPATVIAIFGAVGACLALRLAVAWSSEPGGAR